jgi:hypothetical protein
MPKLEVTHIKKYRSLRQMVNRLHMRTKFKQITKESIDKFNSPISEWVLAEKLLQEKFPDRFWSLSFGVDRSCSITVILFN